ncbi:glycosyltransferase [Agrococcus lahaulensis]|uniref:glycosyltransferase n=1 Tax=Agrococcus lahaulensis TaxID=341722 RepID=UPI00041DF89B|nr:glycosyltransferase [Agrococcus lahaulensis]
MTEDWRTSVVMAVYHRVDPEHFARALGSMMEQTLAPDEVVVVEDGPLGPGLLAVLDEFAGHRVPLVRVALPENRGSAIAAQAGLEVAQYPWIVRMDSDDVAVPERLQVQMDAVRAGDVDVLGAAMEEFDGEEDRVVGTRALPLEHDEIARYARINSPVNNPTAVIRREHLVAVGGYRPVPLMEDYDVFARLLAHGSRFRNLPQALVRFRAGEAMFDRRSGRGMLRAERMMQRNLVRYGLVSRPRSWGNFVARSAFRALPRTALRRAYGRLFHRR